MRAKVAPNWGLQLICVTCVAFTCLSAGDFLFSRADQFLPNMIISFSVAVFAVFGGPILRAKVVNGQEVKNG